MITVYLAGGMQNDWRRIVLEECAGSGITFIDPCRHGLETPREYTAWDLLGIKKSDIVFAYLEKTNPSGYGLSLEVGYAKALSKTMILVNEQTDYTGMLESVSDVVFTDFVLGVKHLKSYDRLL